VGTGERFPIQPVTLVPDIPVFKSEIPLLIAFRKASAEGITAREVKGDPNARRAWLAYERVGKEVMSG
jgi:chromosome partitioning protein